MTKLKIGIILALGAYVWHALPPHRKLQLRFILKQAPSIPGRYLV